jgi:hypothetical protein
VDSGNQNLKGPGLPPVASIAATVTSRAGAAEPPQALGIQVQVRPRLLVPYQLQVECRAAARLPGLGVAWAVAQPRPAEPPIHPRTNPPSALHLPGKVGVVVKSHHLLKCPPRLGLAPSESAWDATTKSMTKWWQETLAM